MTSIAVINSQGSMNKTTTVLMMGVALARQGRRVLLIDLDPQVHLSLALGIAPQLVPYSIAHVLLRLVPLKQACAPTSLAGLEVAPGSSEIRLSDLFLPGKNGSAELLKEAVQSCGTYDDVIIDCPAALNVMCEMALNAARLAVIPMKIEEFSVAGLERLSDFVEEVRQRSNPELDYRLIVNGDPKQGYHSLARQVNNLVQEISIPSSPVVQPFSMQPAGSLRTPSKTGALGTGILGL